MFKRHLQSLLGEELQFSPAVALLGPRQVGKTTLALEVARNIPHVYLDLESDRDRGKLAQAVLYLDSHLDKLVILDEVHRAPGLFLVLRGLIDQARRLGHASGQYLLLGSASLDVLHQSGETLAGRIAYLELGPLNVLETGQSSEDALWLRGGFPQSLNAPTDARSLRWRQNFIRTYLERDIPQLGPRIAAETLRRFWTMLAHQQGGLLNVAQLARNLGVDAKTAHSYIDLLCDLLLVRRLQPWHANLGKRLVKSPKVYVRDSGLVHALLGLKNENDVLGHPVAGASYEGFVLETLITQAGPSLKPYFYRTHDGAEIDLLFERGGQPDIAIEVKRSSAPSPERGFKQACDDLGITQRYVVYPGNERFSLRQGAQAIGLQGMLELLNPT